MGHRKQGENFVVKSINPLRVPAPKEVPLENAPLLRVIGQIRFPLIENINNEKFIAQFQEAIKGRFPILRKKLQEIMLTPTGPIKTPDSTIWRFQSVDQSSQVSLTTSFLALETIKYSNRGDFISNLQTAYSYLDEMFEIPLVDRIGLRYIDRIEFDSIEELLTLTSPEAAGVLASSIAEDAVLAIQDNQFSFGKEGGQIRARWGMVPPNATFDPATIEPSSKRTWVLDLDTYSNPQKRYSESDIKKTLEDFAEKSYSVFRWVVSDSFLKRFGGNV